MQPSLTLHFLFFFSAFFAATPVRAETPWVAPRKEVLDALEAMDQLGLTEKPRGKTAKALHSPYGFQVHPICLRYLEKHCKLSSAESSRRLRAIVDMAAETMALECHERYGELEPYLKPWATMFRRAVMTCEYNDKKQGAALLATKSMAEDELSAKESAGIDFGDQDQANDAPLVAAYKPTMSLNLKTAKCLKDFDSRTGQMGSIVHEILHATPANNTSKHNTIETHAPKQKGKCDPNDIDDDRINLVTTLCIQGGMHHNQYSSAELLLFEKVSDCGFSSGCERLFSNRFLRGENYEETQDAYYFPAKGLPKPNARALCMKTYNQGYCEKLYATQRAALLSGNKTVVALHDIFFRKLSKLVPVKPLGISRELSELDPSIQKAILRLKNAGGDCFNHIFRMNKAGGAELAQTPADYKTAKSSPAGRLGLIMAALNPEGPNAEFCHDQLDALYGFRNTLTIFQQKYFRSWLYRSLIEERILHGSENMARSDYETILSEASAVPLVEFLGKEKLEEYLKALSVFHKPHPSCSELGLEPILKNESEIEKNRWK